MTLRMGWNPDPASPDVSNNTIANPGQMVSNTGTNSSTQPLRGIAFYPQYAGPGVAIRAMLYKVSDNSLVAQGAITEAVADTENRIDFDSPFTPEDGVDYRFALQADNDNLGVYQDTTAAARTWDIMLNTYTNGAPATWSTSQGNNERDSYVYVYGDDPNATPTISNASNVTQGTGNTVTLSNVTTQPTAVRVNHDSGTLTGTITNWNSGTGVLTYSIPRDIDDATVTVEVDLDAADGGGTLTSGTKTYTNDYAGNFTTAAGDTDSNSALVDAVSGTASHFGTAGTNVEWKATTATPQRTTDSLPLNLKTGYTGFSDIPIKDSIDTYLEPPAGETGDFEWTLQFLLPDNTVETSTVTITVNESGELAVIAGNKGIVRDIERSIARDIEEALNGETLH